MLVEKKYELANLKSSTDLFFVDFLVAHKGVQIFDYKIMENGKVLFHFDIPDAHWRQLKISYNGTEHQLMSLRIKELASFANKRR